jgi:hypothetical protein
MYKLPESVSADMGTPVAVSVPAGLSIASIDTLTAAQRQMLIPIQ